MGQVQKCLKQLCVQYSISNVSCTYNGIFKKDIHYIELQPDFSNIKDVMRKIHDNDFLQKM